MSAACGVSAQIAYSGPIEPDTESGTFGTAGEAGLGGNSNQLGNAGEPGTAVNILKIPAM